MDTAHREPVGEAHVTQPAADSESWNREDSPLEPAEVFDSDDLGSTDAGRDPLDDSWDVPDRPSPGVRYPHTPREEREGSSFAEQLAAELPDADPYLEAERRESGQILRADVYGEDATGLEDAALEDAALEVDDDGTIRSVSAEENALHLE
ncbi:hypothetical protein [Candidatus Frankia alpina]|uniref:DUF5709 domain-containing protein n=1 Tax=Candidatus Frankia alpina TaxID=2699483 RepID=A0A4S5EJZ4_9ACTN|nr:hypothetical protein [Candidatus Frankia alpina]THJ72243.1 hypothetical protein E7Y31_14825 [Candidatus Frankia alpina]